MKSRENIMIVMLLITMAVLGVLFVGSMKTQEAYAGASSRAAFGDYIMAQGNISSSTQLLYVVDIPNQRFIVYGVDAVMNKITPMDKVDLKRIFRSRR